MNQVFVTVETLREIIKGEMKEIVLELVNKAAQQVGKYKFDPNKHIFTLKEAAEYLSLSTQTVRRFTKIGKIKRAFEDIRDYRYHRTELDRFITGYRK
jgi:excisionase family DNA binding protein